MGARGNKHGQQRRRNTTRAKADWMASGIRRANEQIRRQDDAEVREAMRQVNRRNGA